MKKLAFIAFGSLLLASCAAKVDTKAQVGIKGNWQVSSVNYAGSNMFPLKSFQIADSKCFVGSTWHFVSNNNTGTMSLNQSGCPAVDGDFKWTVTPNQDFTLKFVGEGEKAKNVTAGFFLKVRNQSANQFQLVDQTNIGGRPTEVVYTFNRIN
ncbi:lipocalin family protein [Flavobacterium agricola]|uniref:Lipocalin family protein n=1 Tax=Flavobacterium agricola TaxID=2870839 RepID=A0ABY6LZH3_9FLAO|nr:lipocalin family protein [Flavobacterium agricola]UYW01591.1 lipocalin family protein [Flavobacterium agricola]